MTTWHPAFVGYSPAKASRGFLLHVERACQIAFEGKKPDKPPLVHYNPTARKAQALFRSWDYEFACDIETPNLKDHRIMSIAVSGDPDEAMVWSLENPKIKRTLGPLKEALAKAKRIVFQNGDFDVPILDKHGLKVRRPAIWDTMIENQMLHPDEPVNLSYLASLCMDTEAWKHLRGEGGEDLLFYNALDVCYDWRVYLATEDHYEEFERRTL